MVKGIYIPLITPFLNDKVDEPSLRKLVNHYLELGVQGFVPLGTTGEAPCIREDEHKRILHIVLEEVDGAVPVYAGYGGNDTYKVKHGLRQFRSMGLSGILSVSPYYNRPSQEGIIQHFQTIAESSSLPIILYNIPYRTGRNMTNETILKLAEHENIIGLKDACGDLSQSVQFLMDRPKDFSVLCGEDIQLLAHLAHGADGGILASAHLQTESFLRIYHLMVRNNGQKALDHFRSLVPMIKLLFEEPNPAPIKYILQQRGQITSDEVRLPLLKVTDSLKAKLDILGGK